MKRLAPLLAPLVLTLAGCSEPAAGVGDGESDASETDGGTTGDVGGTTGATDGGSTGGPVEFVPIPARGIRISEVEANQGVAVPIAIDGQWVDGTGRNAQLVQNRRLLIRAYWDIDEDFESREIEGRLIYVGPDGEEQVSKKVLEIFQDSSKGVLDRSFWWLLPEDLVVPGMKFQVELYETDFGYEDTPEPDPLPLALVEGGPRQVGIEQSYQVLRARIVPIDHDLGPDCPEPPEVSDDDLQVMIDELHEHNPTELVEIDVREPYTFTGDMDSFSPLLSDLAQLRFDDNADPSIYYYGVVRACGGGPSGVGGQAIDIPSWPQVSNAYSRTAVGRWYNGISGTAETFVHELGHTQGRRHVECSGEGGPDPLYPTDPEYDGGRIGVWGFGILSFALHNPGSARDYMTYCSKPWVSDYGWRKVFPFIEEISTWDMNAPAPRPEGELLVGLQDADGTETWFTVPGTIDAPAVTDTSIELRLAGVTHHLDAQVGEMGDGGTNVAVQLPPGTAFDQVQALTKIQAGVPTAIAPASVRAYRPGTLTTR